MKIQVSKVFASFINQVAKDRNLNFSAEVVEIPSNSYGFLVGNCWEGEIDYNFKTDKFKTIKIVYPYEYYCNPVYVYIYYFRTVTMGSTIPSLEIHGLCAIYALVFLGIGCLIYKKCNHEFLYYV